MTNSFATIVPAVVLDWAGTTVDHGCRAPVFALQRVLRRHGFEVSADQVRRDMGRAKKEHLRALLSLHRVEHLTESLYPELEVALFSELEAHATLIDGTLRLVDWLRAKEVRIGTTTGYTSAMMDVIAPLAAAQGYLPDTIVTPDQVAAGRPAPDMLREVARRLDVHPVAAFVKIGDTPSDIAEGRNAGAWTIGVAASGNAIGLSAPELASLPAGERAARIRAARTALRGAGADYVVDSVADCTEVLLEIFARQRDAAIAGLPAGEKFFREAE